MYRIFLVEDDAALAAEIKTLLEGWGDEVRCAEDLKNVTGEFEAFRPHLVLMDITLPFFNGYHWCGQLRRISNVPVMFISAAADDMNVVMAINMGADDFIAKPVEPMVLTAKVRALLRRTYELKSMEALNLRDAVLDLSDGTLEYKGERTELTRNELRILRTLLENRGKVVSREQLMIRLWQDDCYVEENTLTVNVARLRKKLESCGLGDAIVTRPGDGYMLQ